MPLHLAITLELRKFRNNNLVNFSKFRNICNGQIQGDFGRIMLKNIFVQDISPYPAHPHLHCAHTGLNMDIYCRVPPTIGLQDTVA